MAQQTAREEANRIFKRMLHQIEHNTNLDREGLAKQCALIAVDEIKEQLLQNLSNDVSAIHAIYWEKVKQEIEKL